MHNFNCTYCLFGVADPEPHHCGKLDPDLDPHLHQNRKLDPDPNPQQSEKQDPEPNPHHSKKVETLVGALEGPNLENSVC